MAENISDNNVVAVAGKIVSEKKFSHEVCGEGFYIFNLEVMRLSGEADVLPVTISERILENETIEVGKYMKIKGQLRSYNSYENKKNHLILTIFARDIESANVEDISNGPNQICLNGYVCRLPIYRTTPFGREISDILLAVNRPYNKSDYIPCITWGRNARYTGKLKVGDNIKVCGRIQSRNYQKKLEDGSVVVKTAYEVSVSKLEICKKLDEIEETEK